MAPPTHSSNKVLPTKKTKKSKADKEQERIANELEAKRLQDEQERALEQKQIENEKAARLALQKRVQLRNAEVARFELHTKDMIDLDSMRADMLSHERQIVKERLEWKTWIAACNDVDNVYEAEARKIIHSISLNTHLSELRDGITSATMSKVMTQADSTGRMLQMLGEEMLFQMSQGPVKEIGAESIENDNREQEVKEFENQSWTMLTMQINHAIAAEMLQIVMTASNEEDVDGAIDNHLLVVAGGTKIKGDGKTGLALWSSCGKKGLKPKRVDVMDVLGMIVDPPKSLLSSIGIYVAIRVARLLMEPRFQHRYDRRITKDFVLVGGGFTYQVDLYRLPALPKVVDEWTIRWNVVENQSYGEENDGTLSSSLSAKGSIMSSQLGHSLKCQIAIPDHIILSNEIIIATWNDETEEWSREGISDVHLDEGRGTLVLNLYSTRIFGIVQSKTLDLPYTYWFIRPILAEVFSTHSGTFVHENRIEICMDTPRYSIKLHVHGTMCELVESSLPTLNKYFASRRLSPAQLFSELSKSGVHLLPSDSDAKRVNITLKTNAIEERVCCDLSLLCTSFKLKSSSFNKALGSLRGCYQVQESDEFTGVECDPSPMRLAFVEMDYESDSCQNAPGANTLPLHCGRVSCSLVKGTVKTDPGTCQVEDISELNLLPEEGTESSLFQLFCMRSVSSLEAIERTKFSNTLTTQTVKQVLTLTRLFQFC